MAEKAFGQAGGMGQAIRYNYHENNTILLLTWLIISYNTNASTNYRSKD